MNVAGQFQQLKKMHDFQHGYNSFTYKKRNTFS